MGQQESEETAELIATVQGEHVAMKRWYNETGANDVRTELREKYGPYPDFSREVLSWSGWKDARKAYLKYTSTSTSTGPSTPTVKFEAKDVEGNSAGKVKDEARGIAKEKPVDMEGTTTEKSTKQEEDEEKEEDTERGRRKRRSRWSTAGDDGEKPVAVTPIVPASTPGPGPAPVVAAVPPVETTKEPEAAPAPRRRKSRWGAPTNKAAVLNNNNVNNNPPPSSEPATKVLKPTAATGILGLLPGMPAGMTQEQLAELSSLQNRLKIVNTKLANLDVEALRVDALPRDHPDRSPSPPPVYGADGIRKNTRAVRWRERYTTERQDCLEKIMDLNPSLRPPGFVKRKRHNKVFIPVNEHPTYNFIGLIIGPRGKTQKEMEFKTNCKIAIRGRGSVKEGARGRRDGKPMDGDDEPLHVVITGDDQASVDMATKMVKDMLVVIDDEVNTHKQQQLRELALLNGTLKDEEFCHICAEKGHRSFECPRRFSTANSSSTTAQLLNIVCAICGDTSHPTRDCTQKNNGNNPLCPIVPGTGTAADTTATANAAKQLDDDYQNFMAELDGKQRNDNNNNNNNNNAPEEKTVTEPPAATPTTLPPPTVPVPPQVPLPPPPVYLPPPPEAVGMGMGIGAAMPPPQYTLPPYGATGPVPHMNMNMLPAVAYHQQPLPSHTGYNAEANTVSGWDYRSFYDPSGGDVSGSSGAGGFNWWESNS